MISSPNFSNRKNKFRNLKESEDSNIRETKRHTEPKEKFLGSEKLSTVL